MGYSVQEALNRFGGRSGGGDGSISGSSASRASLQTQFGSSIEVKGLAELKQKMADIPKVLRRRVLRNALAAAAREVRDTARRNAPVLNLGTSLKAPYRKPGTVKQAIRVRTSKADTREGNVGVFVNVKPVKNSSGQRGAKNPNDPYYWRWQEFGWTPATGPRKGAAGKAGKRDRRRLVKAGASPQIPGKHFLQSGANRLPAALAIFEERIAKWMIEIDASGVIKP